MEFINVILILNYNFDVPFSGFVLSIIFDFSASLIVGKSIYESAQNFSNHRDVSADEFITK